MNRPAFRPSCDRARCRPGGGFQRLRPERPDTPGRGDCLGHLPRRDAAVCRLCPETRATPPMAVPIPKSGVQPAGVARRLWPGRMTSPRAVRPAAPVIGARHASRHPAPAAAIAPETLRSPVGLRLREGTRGRISRMSMTEPVWIAEASMRTDRRMTGCRATSSPCTQAPVGQRISLM